jgi:hypothetical protein
MYSVLKLARSKGPNRVGVSLPSPEDRNRLSLWNVVFSSYLEFWMMDRAHKASDCVIRCHQDPLDYKISLSVPKNKLWENTFFAGPFHIKFATWIKMSTITMHYLYQAWCRRTVGTAIRTSFPYLSLVMKITMAFDSTHSICCALNKY